MASVHLRVNCGCGFRAVDLEEAKKHSDKTGHTAHVLGEVTAPKPLPLVIEGGA